MKIAPVVEIKAKFSAYLEESKSGPVIVTKNGKAVAVLLAVEDEEELERLILAYSPKFQAIMRKGKAQIEAGESLSQAFAKHSRIFPNIFISMVRAAEASGNLSKILNRYAEFAEAQADLQRKIREALFYPIILIVSAIGIIVFIATLIYFLKRKR